jgi:hypothetical protein
MYFVKMVDAPGYFFHFRKGYISVTPRPTTKLKTALARFNCGQSKVKRSIAQSPVVA